MIAVSFSPKYFFILLFLCFISNHHAFADYVAREHAILEGLDKITARISPLPIYKNKSVMFGSLKITMVSCFQKPPTEPPESTAYLIIEEQYTQEKSKEVFKGWMFASSPAINPLQHPVYDIWLKECKTTLQ